MGRKDVIIKELIEEMIGMKIEKEAEEEKVKNRWVSGMYEIKGVCPHKC